MSRQRKTPEENADDRFRREIRVKQGYYNLMSQTELAKSCQISQPTLSRRLAKPEDLTVAELRKIVGTIEPDPVVMLVLIGYSAKDMKAMKEQGEGV